MIDPTEEGVISRISYTPNSFISYLSNSDFESLWLLPKPHRLPRGLNSIILGEIYHPPGNDDIDLQTHITENVTPFFPPTQILVLF
jgi:hypothetical protein